MEARTPDQLHPLWVDAHNMGDLDAMMALCEPSVCFVTWSGGSIAGADAVRGAYRAILETKPHMTLGSTVETIECGVELCLVLFRWTSTATLPDGTATTFCGPGDGYCPPATRRPVAAGPRQLVWHSTHSLIVIAARPSPNFSSERTGARLRSQRPLNVALGRRAGPPWEPAPTSGGDSGIECWADERSSRV
jgi:ketosteroid isomerase-like protein